MVRKVIFSGIALSLLALVVLIVFPINLLSEQTTLINDPTKYRGAEFIDTKLESRRWMNLAIDVVKDESMAPSIAGRFYAYVASVYSDTLDVTHNKEQASLSTYKFLLAQKQDYKPKFDTTLAELGYKVSAPIPEAQAVISEYLNRWNTDGFYLTWDKNVPVENGWYIRDDKFDGGAMSGSWKSWILEGEQFVVPAPPKWGSLLDKYEITKVEYATSRKNRDFENVYFWHGTRAFVKGQLPDNITPAGVWQNILFIETGDLATEEDFAHNQKVLAQTIADAFIEVWKVKYQYFTQRPSMRSSAIHLMVNDPPFPSYVSGHSGVSEAAATVLSEMYPNRKELWESLSKDARNSRLISGIHFEVDNNEGAVLGYRVGVAVVEKLFDKKLDPPKGKSFWKDNLITIFFKNLVMRAQMKYDDFRYKHLVSSAQMPTYKHIPEKINNDIDASMSVNWVDINGDDKQDLFANNRLYMNDGSGQLVATDSLAEGAKQSHTGAVFFDFDNDSCVDVYLSRYGDIPSSLSSEGASDSLFKGDCGGGFKDISESAGIGDRTHGFGVAVADYDSDGFLDIYVANWGVVVDKSTSMAEEGTTPDNYKTESNILWHNNGDGTFTNAVKEARVDGLAHCNSLMRNSPDVYEYNLKPSYQPIWFDYNNDNLIDLFVATDNFVSPLYKNNGDKTFTEVTEMAGLCLHGNASNMGVTVGDYNNDGYLDIYVTNGGTNDFWENNGDGTFKDVMVETNADDKGYGWGTEFFDANNDGLLDILVVNGNNNEALLHDSKIKQDNRDEILMQLKNGTFLPVGNPAGLFGNEVKRGGAVGDVNGDGHLDIFIASKDLDTLELIKFFEAIPNKNNWIGVKLIGTNSNRDAIGTMITLRIGKTTQVRQVNAGSSFLSQSQLQQHFGLGDNKKIDEIEILWSSGKRQILRGVKANQVLTITEDQ